MVFDENHAFQGQIHNFWLKNKLKTTVLGSFRPWLLPQLKTTLKTAVFSLKNCGFPKWEEPSWKPQFSAENCGFQCGFQMWEEPRPKTMVFSWKPWFLTENRGFRPKLCPLYRRLQFSAAKSAKTVKTGSWAFGQSSSKVFRSKKRKTKQWVSMCEKHVAMLFTSAWMTVRLERQPMLLETSKLFTPPYYFIQKFIKWLVPWYIHCVESRGKLT